jgi:hypothetical protein
MRLGQDGRGAVDALTIVKNDAARNSFTTKLTVDLSTARRLLHSGASRRCRPARDREREYC